MRECIDAHFECDFSTLILSIVLNYCFNGFDKDLKSAIFLFWVAECFIVLLLKVWYKSKLITGLDTPVTAVTLKISHRSFTLEFTFTFFNSSAEIQSSLNFHHGS